MLAGNEKLLAPASCTLIWQKTGLYAIKQPTSFLSAFTENAYKYPDRVALEFIDPPLQRQTYTELNELVNRTAGYLQSMGLQHGDRVALQLSKCLKFILLHLATVRLEAISLPLNPAYPPDELKYFLEDSGAKLFFALESSKEKIQTILPELQDLQECVFLNPDIPDEFQSIFFDYPSSRGLSLRELHDMGGEHRLLDQ
jgi:acyl-CoA synthetase (AMP-forming)/AMP-acid ligase II